MITLVVPTRNRASILSRTAPSYFDQNGVDELIFVDDAGSDDIGAVLTPIALDHPNKSLVIVRNAQPLGASQSRNVGVAYSRNRHILFCDDDELLQEGYAHTCLMKLREHDASIVSGRRIYMLVGETPRVALKRFGIGTRNTSPLRRVICEYVNSARFGGDLDVPLTNAVILTPKELLIEHPFDAYYARGNGYREETDYQMNLYTRGHKIVVTNATHSFHLPLEEVTSGGHRTGRLRRLYWSIFYTRYFYGKYYEAYAARQGLLTPRWLALVAFSAFATYRIFVFPLLLPVARRYLARRSYMRGMSQS